MATRNPSATDHTTKEVPDPHLRRGVGRPCTASFFDAGRRSGRGGAVSDASRSTPRRWGGGSAVKEGEALVERGRAGEAGLHSRGAHAAAESQAAVHSHAEAAAEQHVAHSPPLSTPVLCSVSPTGTQVQGSEGGGGALRPWLAWGDSEPCAQGGSLPPP